MGQGGAFGPAPVHIAAGPDGNLWLPDFYEPTIWRMTPDGQFTGVKIPADDNGQLHAPDDITMGPDGNLWFAASSEKDCVIGRITL
jgi:virginiamycin B lyase